MANLTLHGQTHTPNQAAALGEKALVSKEYGTAQDFFGALLDDPATPPAERVRAHVGMGYLQLAAGNPAEALNQAFTAREADPAHLKAYHLALLALDAMKTPLDRRAFWCDGGLAHHPADIGLRMGRTLIDNYLGNHAVAAAAAQDLLPRVPAAETHAGLVLASILSFNTPAETWAEAFRDVKPHTPLIDVMNEVYRQIGHWFAGDISAMRDSIGRAKALYPTIRADAITVHSPEEWKHVNESYHNAASFLYMNEELAKRPPSPNLSLPPLHMVGESHTLPPHGQTTTFEGKPHRLHSHFCLGTKLWFLADATQPHYRHKMRAVLSALPPGPLLLVLGEIDTRATEGIWVVAKTKGRPLAGVIAATVAGGLGWLKDELAAHPPRPVILCGIPAPVKKRDAPQFATPDEHTAYAGMIAEVNREMARHAKANGWMFLDVHALTANAQGFSTGTWHMELTHLLPGAISEAFTHHLVGA